MVSETTKNRKSTSNPPPPAMAPLNNVQKVVTMGSGRGQVGASQGSPGGQPGFTRGPVSQGSGRP